MRAIDNKTEWVKFGKIENFSLMGKDVICFGYGCHIFFYNLNTGRKDRLTANYSEEYGDGVKNLCGHKTSYIFAYAEFWGRGHIFVRAYPSFQLIWTCTDAPERSFTCITFADSSLLFALGDLPNYQLFVWNWRTGEKLSKEQGEKFNNPQKLRCNSSRPIYIIQLSNVSTNVTLWSMLSCCKKNVLRKHSLELPKDVRPLCDALYNQENTTFVVDVVGSVYVINQQITFEKIIDVELQGSNYTCLSWYKAGLVVSGPNDEVRHYKKMGKWENDWSVSLTVGLKTLSCFRSDYLIGVTVNETIIKISPDRVTDLCLTGCTKPILDICLIYPTGKHVAVILKINELVVFETNTGEFVNKYELNGEVTCVTENPEYPYMVVGYEDGTVELLSLYDANDIKLLTKFKLFNMPLNEVKFFESGKIFVIGNTNVGQFFVIEGIPGGIINIVTHVDIGVQIVDFIMVASKHCYRLFTLPLTSKRFASNQIIRHCIMNKEHIDVKKYQIEPDTSLYYKMACTDKPERDRIFYALSLFSRCIHILEMRRGELVVRKIGEITTGHQIRKPNFRLDNYHAVTWGYDGFIFARSKDFTEEIGMVLPHHRTAMGVRKAYIHPCGKYIISLGYEGALCCTNITENIWDESRENLFTSFLESEQVALMFQRPTIGFNPEDHYENMTWLEVEEMIKIHNERRICEKKRHAILAEVNELRKILKMLVTKNMFSPENEKIDSIEFFLDTPTYNKLKNENTKECKKKENYLKALIKAQDKVTNHLKNAYLQPMDVHGKMIKGMFQNTNTTNYVLLPKRQEFEGIVDWVIEIRKVQSAIGSAYKFKPWLNTEVAEIANSISNIRIPIRLPLQDYRYVKNLLTVMSQKQVTLEDQMATMGTITQSIIERHPAHYRQAEIETYYQCLMEEVVVNYEKYQLKEHYNKIFDVMMEDKYREMDNVKKKNNRLRTIISEYNYFSEEKIYIDIEDPEWSQEEQPWLITQVSDDEIPERPYISPSEQAILDAKNAEAERIRLALLADDFRERALMAMMNGVLEVRWEDELKKDVPLPKCMIEKDPAQFNEDDLRAVKDYEEKVAFLNSERERYKNLLDVEYTKVSTSVRDSIRKFNQKLQECLTTKMLVESACKQENLIVNRIRVEQCKRIQFIDKKKLLKQIIERDEKFIEELTEVFNLLNEAQKECKNNVDVLLAKEKLLEKSFRKEIMDYSPVVQEQAIKLYKKRPKVTYRFYSSSTVLFELAKCLVTQEKSYLLSQEALDYLKAVEVMDTYTGLPQTIDEQTFQAICKQRRTRFEFELRVKGLQLMLNYGETTTSEIMKEINLLKETVAENYQNIETVHNDMLFLMHNIELQIVLRRGLVEITLTGDLHDFEDAILLPKAYVDEVNGLISSAGDKKIATMKRNMAFRRNIMATEWEHKRLRMHINDLIEQIKDIRGIKFTKDMQTYLKNKVLGRKTDSDSYEQEVELLTNIYTQAIKDKTNQYKKIKSQTDHYKTHNEKIDKTILNINMDVCLLKLQEDVALAKRESRAIKDRMSALLQRSNLVKQIQRNHQDILMLQTELELLRLKTYPTFKYKVIDDD